MADQNTASQAIPIRVLIVDTNGVPIAGGVASAVTIANGGDFAEGAVSDAAWSGSGDGTVIAILKKLAAGGGSAVSIADGSDVAEGATTDAAVTTDANGTVSGKLRGIVKLLAGTLTIQFTAPQHVIADSGTISTITNVVHVDDNTGSLTVDNATISVVGGGTEATAQRVTIASDSTGVLSVDDNGASLTVDNPALSVVGGGTEATAQRVTIASDSTGVLSVDDNGGALTIDGTLTGITNVVHVDDNSSSLTVDGTVTAVPGTPTDLAAASPAAASVGVASAQAVAANASRKGLVFVNTSGNRISFGLGATAVLDSGITLYPGGVWEMDERTFDTAAVNAIASAASSNLAIQEFS